MKLFYHVVKVKGIGQFPIDMLRYDGLHPKSESDSGKIINTFFQSENKIEIKLAKFATKSWKPQEERWKSFLYKVLDHEIKDY